MGGMAELSRGEIAGGGQLIDGEGAQRFEQVDTRLWVARAVRFDLHKAGLGQRMQIGFGCFADGDGSLDRAAVGKETKPRKDHLMGG